MKLSLIINELEDFAPTSLQEDYDNSGLLVGDMGMEISSALICMDITDEVMQEASKGGFNLVISHHPFIFTGIKRVTEKNMQNRILVHAIKNDIAIYAIHTNLDNNHLGWVNGH